MILINGQIVQRTIKITMGIVVRLISVKVMMMMLTLMVMELQTVVIVLQEAKPHLLLLTH